MSNSFDAPRFSQECTQKKKSSTPRASNQSYASMGDIGDNQHSVQQRCPSSESWTKQSSSTIPLAYPYTDTTRYPHTVQPDFWDQSNQYSTPMLFEPSYGYVGSPVDWSQPDASLGAPVQFRDKKPSSMGSSEPSSRTPKNNYDSNRQKDIKELINKVQSMYKPKPTQPEALDMIIREVEHYRKGGKSPWRETPRRKSSSRPA
ncbi:hypothetical protein HGRIS_006713 [Hohenbuehelia grisea]